MPRIPSTATTSLSEHAQGMSISPMGVVAGDCNVLDERLVSKNQARGEWNSASNIRRGHQAMISGARLWPFWKPMLNINLFREIYAPIMKETPEANLENRQTNGSV